MKNYEDMAVLVTGATGFLGQHLVPSLLKKGAKVIGISLEGKQQSTKNFLHFNVDLKDQENLSAIIKKTKPQKVIHLAAYPDKEPSFESTDNCVQNNIQGTLNLLHSLSSTNYNSFIHVGSYKEYSGNKTPFRETDALFPLSDYAISKYCAEMFGMAYHKLHGMPFTSIRFATIYGPKQSAGNLVPHIIKACLENKALKLTKGEQKRELLYISDAMGALDSTMTSKNANGEIINIGTGEEYSIKEIVNLILKLANSKLKPEFGAIPYRKNEIWSMKGNIAKAKKLLKWEPKTSLMEGLAKTINYYKNAER